jgi:hypothetical protein
MAAAPQLLIMLTSPTRLPAAAAVPWAGTDPSLSLAGHRPLSRPAVGPGQGLLAMPFDALRFQYACGVMAGLVQRSLLASGRWERAIDALERLTLGPLARQR